MSPSWHRFQRLAQCCTSSIVLIPFVRALRASVENRRALVGASQLLGIVSRLGVTAFVARSVDDSVSFYGTLVDFLNIGAEAGS